MWITLIIVIAIIVVISFFSNCEEDEQISEELTDRGDKKSDCDDD